MFIANGLDLRIHMWAPVPLNLHHDAKAGIIGADTCFQSSVFQRLPVSLQNPWNAVPRNWCLCRWNSSIVTISEKWQQCSPDQCLRDDILLNSISFLIIFSCSIYHLSLSCQWCTPLLFSHLKYISCTLSPFFLYCSTCDFIPCD